MGASQSCSCEVDAQPSRPPVIDVETGSRISETMDEDDEVTLEESGQGTPRPSFRRILTVRSLELMRGIALKETLRFGGWLWKQSPIDLPERDREALWSYSRRVAHFDIFLSHTWATSGRRKYVSLSFQYGWAHALLVWLMVLLLVEAMSCLDVLPSWGSVRMDFQGFVADCPFNGAGIFIALPLSMIAFVSAPYLPDVCGSSSHRCFLDVVSIHQCDKKLMQSGIYGIGGFLGASDELRILYSAPYLSRLWCLFELAAFRTANPTGRIRFAPLFVELGVACAWLGGGVGLCIYVGMIAAGGRPSAIIILPAMIPLFFVFHTLRKNMSQKKQVFKDLATFDVNAAECRQPADREFIFGAIQEWYGSPEAFTAYVRGPLRDELLKDHAGTNMPWHYAMLCLLPWISLGADALTAIIRAGAPLHCILSYGIAVSLGLFTCWSMASIQFCMFLCERCPLPKGGVLAVAQSSLLFFLYGVVVYAGVEAGAWAYKDSVVASLVWCSLTGALSWASSGGLRACRAAFGSKSTSKPAAAAAEADPNL